MSDASGGGSDCPRVAAGWVYSAARRLLRARCKFLAPRCPSARSSAQGKEGAHPADRTRGRTPSTAVLYDVLVSGPSLLLGAFAVGAAFGTKAGETPRQRVRAFFTRNPPLYAAIAGILAPSALAPPVLVDVSQALIVAILPIGFFAVGATLAENAEHGQLPMPPPLSRPVVVALVSRLAVVPALLMLLAAPLIDLPTAHRLLSAMPSGLNSMVVAHAYGLDMEITAEAVTWSTAIVVAAALVSLVF